jgi:hypothetical protein
MRRLIFTSILALVALASIVATASAATHAPVITSFSPSQVAVGQTLVLHGKYFQKGVKNNRVFFSRATDGKTVRTRPSKANSTKTMSVVVPAGVTGFLTVTNGVAQPTRFQIQLLSGKFSKKTAKSKSPIILPAGAVVAPGTPGSTPTTVTPPPPSDCDGDGVPDSQDTDDDNDGLPDTLEAQIHTDPCKADTDGDGVGDAYEYYASLDLNHNPNYAGKRPYPNPLDPTDAKTDFDGDGMTMLEEYAASALLGDTTVPPLPYSDGNQMSAAPANPGAMDLDGNGRYTDEEKDADNDGIPNWIEMAKGEITPSPNSNCQFAASDPVGTFGAYANAFTSCDGGTTRMPNGTTFTAPSNGHTITGGIEPAWIITNALNFVDPDSDGDGIPDGADDQDGDLVPNLEEITPGNDGLQDAPTDPCDPNTESPTCPTHASHSF